MIFKRALHRRIGGFAPLRYAHDWAFALRAGVVGNPLYIPHFLTKYRVHSTNTIKASKEEITAEVRVLFETFLSEYPDCMRRSVFRRGLQGNRYLPGVAIMNEDGTANCT